MDEHRRREFFKITGLAARIRTGRMTKAQASQAA